MIKKISLQVLGATNFSEEKIFYNKIFGTKMNKFINRYEKRNAYKIVDQAKVIVNMNSTLGYEAIARGNNVAFFQLEKNLSLLL